MENEARKMNFSDALDCAKAGQKIARTQFRDTCYIMAQFPDINSKMTKPYLIMYKKNAPANDGEKVREYEIFPVDLSCESIFAEDWYVLE